MNDNKTDSFSFLAKLNHAKILLTFIKAVHFRDDGNFILGDNGLKVTVEEYKVLQGNAFIQRDFFDGFDLPDSWSNEDSSFKLHLPLIIETLNIFKGGGVQPLQISYSGYGTPLRLHLEDQGTISDASIKTRKVDEILDFSFSQDDVNAKIIFISEYIKDILGEINSGTEFIQFTVCPNESSFTISCTGGICDSSIVIPETSELVDYFVVKKKVRAKFKYSLFRQCLKPLGISEKLSLRLNSRNFICLQYMIQIEENTGFLEFYCAPEEENEDDDNNAA